MLFGSISYLNLLPFQIFLKRSISHSGAKMSFGYKRAVPSEINKALHRRTINAAFISSVSSGSCRCTKLGIIAKKRVYSVLLLDQKEAQDPASETSNQLAKVLELQGRVLIGDAALKYHLEGGEAIDLAEAWYEQTKLPFVFARLCYNRYGQSVESIANKFIQSRFKIPQYILKKEAKKRGITPQALRWYLEHIHYEMDNKAEQSLKLFLKKSKIKHHVNR